MRERSKLLVCLIAAGIALAPLPAAAQGFDGFSLDELSVGLEINKFTKGIDAANTYSWSSRFPISGTYSAELDNAVDSVKLTEVLAKVGYHVNDHFTPFVLLGSSGLDFDDDYTLNLASYLGSSVSVPYSDSMSVAYGLGAEGVLMELPAELKLTYGLRTFTFSSSDSAAVSPEEFSALLLLANPIEDVEFSTDVTYREWDISFAVTREFDFDDYTVTPQLGYRHASISMETSTDIEYFAPGTSYYIEGTSDRSLGGSLSSVTLGVTGNYQEFIAATLLLAIGDETGISLAVNYGF